LNGHKDLPIDRVPDAKLGRPGAIEERVELQALAGAVVHPLGGRREADQHLRLQVTEELPVRVCGRVVDLVHDDDVEVLGRDRVDVAVERLDRPEHVPAGFRTAASDQQFAERRLLQRGAERLEALLQDPLAVRHEEDCVELRAPDPLAAKAPVVQCGDNSLAGSGRRDDEVPRAAARASDCEVVQNGALEVLRLDIEHLQGRGAAFDLAAAPHQASPREALAEELPIQLRAAERGEPRGRVLPVPAEHRLELLDHVRHVRGRDPYVPLDAVGQRLAREIRRADVGGRET
jgi:hypothetical protein